MRELLRLVVHALVLWVLARGLVGLAISSGTQSLWALAAATAAVVLLAGAATALLTRALQDDLPVLARRLLPVPLLAAAWTALSASSHEATAAQTAVATGAWVVGAVLGVALVRVLGRRRRARQREMRSSFA
jgi:hypothetical protein